MALNESDLSELLAALKAGDMTHTVRTSLEGVLQQLIEAEATAVIGARPHECSELRVNQRNGHRPKLVSTAAGDIELAIPKLREGSFFPSLLERRRRGRARGLSPLQRGGTDAAERAIAGYKAIVAGPVPTRPRNATKPEGQECLHAPHLSCPGRCPNS